ncbi:PIN domain-containing protein [Deinococcus koreensis]|uniref:PIN domain-containing protein n=1 Tax=Deinococcus koreensis TaxID=2054903 RepID=UPI001A9FFA24
MLYPSLIRNLLMHLAVSGLVAARWTDEIQDEWIRNLLAARPDLSAERLQRTRRFMEQAVPDAQVTGYEGIVPSLSLPDADDRHVLAAAIHAGAEFLVTFNLKDFPVAALHSLDVLTPDGLVCRLLDSSPEATVDAVEGLRITLRQPAYPPAEFLERLERVGLPEAARRLQTHHDLLADDR